MKKFLLLTIILLLSPFWIRAEVFSIGHENPWINEFFTLQWISIIPKVGIAPFTPQYMEQECKKKGDNSKIQAIPSMSMNGLNVPTITYVCVTMTEKGLKDQQILPGPSSGPQTNQEWWESHKGEIRL